MKKSDIISAVREAKKTGTAITCGDGWRVGAERILSRGAGYAWHWKLYAIKPDGQKIFGGTSHEDSLAAAILRYIKQN